MSLVPSVVGTVAATNAADVGISGRLVIYIADVLPFGFTGLVLLQAAEPQPQALPLHWMIVDAGNQTTARTDARIAGLGMTVDGIVREIREAPRLPVDDSRGGR
jgi:hypothetical protein